MCVQTCIMDLASSQGPSLPVCQRLILAQLFSQHFLANMCQTAEPTIWMNAFVNFTNVDEVLDANLFLGIYSESPHHSLGVIRKGVTHYYAVVETGLKNLSNMSRLRLESVEKENFFTS